jgi:putative endonuclease
MEKPEWKVYLVRCSDNSLYCGITKDLANRLKAHNEGKGAKYTRYRRPVTFMADSRRMTKSDALKLEYRIKQARAGDKISILSKAASRRF